MSMKFHLDGWIVSVALLFAAMTAATAAEPFERETQIYNTYCVQCHGIDRNGRGLNTADMSVQPRDHSDPKGMGDIPDPELFKAIKEGGLAVNKSVLMPAWGGVLTDEQVHDLVRYLRHVCQCGPAQ